jgi:transposase-like protein
MTAKKQNPLFHQPRRLSPKVQQTICQAIETGTTLEIAARAAGIGARTLDEWLQHGRYELQENPDAEGPCADFVRAVSVASAKFEGDCLAIIQDAAPKNWTAAAWLLERKFPERYAKVDRLRVSGDETNDQPVKISDEERKNRLLEKLAKIAEKNFERLGKSDEPEVIEGDVVEFRTPDGKPKPS